MWQLFDRVAVLYEGRQIFFGKITEAKEYFESLGFECESFLQTPLLYPRLTRQVLIDKPLPTSSLP